MYLATKAIRAADCLGDSAVAASDQLAQILGVVTGQERGRTDDITEHYR